MAEEYTAYYHSDLGPIEIVGTAQAIRSVSFRETESNIENLTQENLPPAVQACLSQLDEYFQGQRQQFFLNLELAGTEFQKAVWQELTKISYGQTVTYRDIARSVGNEKAVRAVGHANGQNKIAIIIPCHRVIGSNGQLTGYGGGVWRKAWLLNHETRFSGQQMALF